MTEQSSSKSAYTHRTSVETSGGSFRKPAIVVDGLVKRFGSFTAVNSISFEAASGSIFGLLGANGAGKSTTIRMLCGLLPPTDGNAEVAGIDVGSNPEKVKQNIGYMSQEFSLYNDLTVEENINFFAGVYGLNTAQTKKQRDWIFSLSGLGDRRTSLTGELAGGIKQRLALGCAVLHSPPIVFLDEPTGGVDPISRREFWNLINGLAADGTTVLVTTHYLDEAEYCNRLVFMHAGGIIAAGSPVEIKQNYQTGGFSEIRCSNPLKAVDILSNQKEVADVSLFANTVHIHSNLPSDTIQSLLTTKDIMIESVQSIQPSLEDVFIGLIEHSGPQEVASTGDSGEGAS